jgi:predicted ribosome quality control (RQC) complex YloA/Tae2 family protein
VIYGVNGNDRVVELHFVGHRRDIYELFGEHLRDLNSRIKSKPGLQR